MATVKLFIKPEKIDRQGLTLIQLQYQDNGKRVAFSTGEKIKPKSWDIIKRRVKTGVVGATELNAKLGKLENDLKAILRIASIQDIPVTPEYVREKFDQKRNNTADPTLLQRFEQFRKERRSSISESTLRVYNSVLKILTEFSEVKQFNLSFDKIDLRFYDKFNAYVQDERTLRLNANSTGKYIKTLKTFLNWAVKRGYTDNLQYKDSDFKVIRRDANFEYLTPGELETIRTYDFSRTPYLDRCRDVFVFACLTGLRFSDLENLSRANVKENALEITVQKTKEVLTVPLAPETKAIIRKYIVDEQPLPVVSNQKMNVYLKEVCRVAGIIEAVQVVKFKGATRVIITQPKYELITTHTARRTFVCTALESGMRAEVVMSLTGHSSMKSFQRYVKITDLTKVKAVEEWAIKRGQQTTDETKVIQIGA